MVRIQLIIEKSHQINQGSPHPINHQLNYQLNYQSNSQAHQSNHNPNRIPKQNLHKH